MEENNRSISEIFGDIDAYLFKYNNKAHELYNETKGVDDNSHVGVMAQELKENPVTESTVFMDENGYYEINTQQLTMALSAVVADLSKRVKELEEIIQNGN